MKRIAILVATLALLAAACGGDDDSTTSAESGTRTIKIEMQDIKFSPTTIDVKRGETIRFEFENTGKVAHDAFIGNEAAQADHEIEMNGDKGDQTTESSGMDMGDQTTESSGMDIGDQTTESSGMDHGSGSSDATGITVDPGDTGELTHTFDEAGTVLVGCHQPGHYATGMKVMINVT